MKGLTEVDDERVAFIFPSICIPGLSELQMERTKKKYNRIFPLSGGLLTT